MPKRFCPFVFSDDFVFILKVRAYSARSDLINKSAGFSGFARFSHTPIHMDFLYGFLLKRHQVHVDRRVVGWSAGYHVDHPFGGQISPWPARKVTDECLILRAAKPGVFQTGGVGNFPFLRGKVRFVSRTLLGLLGAV